MKATFWEYFVPVYAAYLCGYFISYSWWVMVPHFGVMLLQLYILDRRDPDGIIAMRKWLKENSQ